MLSLRLLARTLLGIFAFGALPAGTAPLARADGEEKPPEAKKPEEKEAKPYLWVVDGDPKIYLFGTIHIPDDRLTALPPVVKDAAKASDLVLTEVDPAELNSPATQAKVSLPEDKKIEDVLPADALKRLHGYLAGRGIPETAFDRMKPWVIAVTLPQLDILPLLAMKPPMDSTLFTDAKKAGKEAKGLETAAEQIALLESPSEAVQAKLLVATIDELEKAAKEGKNLTEELIQAYLGGDEEKVKEMLEKAAAEGDDDVKALLKKLVDDRNVTMVDRLLALAKDHKGKTVFVAVGAAHYPGSAGILSLLEKKGMKARRLTAADKIPAPAAQPAGTK